MKTLKIKYITAILLILSTGILHSQSPDFTGIKVMLNPGHGGYDSDDRGMPNGYWESEGNLTKGLWLRDLLEARNCEVVMSRVLNRTEDDLDLSQIAAMANENEVDLFLSIHSNAGNQVSNYPMTIFNGKSETPAIPEAKTWAIVLWEQLITNEATFWTNTDPHYIGDLTLNPSWSYGYGVLYPLEVPGIISEGSFHDYEPEMDRLLNIEYRQQEAWNMLYAMESYFNLSGTEPTGNITGIIRDSLLVKDDYTIANSADKYNVVDGAVVEIMETGEIYTVDDQNTGFYYFDSISPGNYHLIFSAEDYFTDTIEIEVFQHQHNHLNYWLRADKTMPAKIISNQPGNGELINCFDPVSITFNMNMDSATTANAFSISPETEGEFSWDEDYLIMSFQPDIPYETNTEYTVNLNNTAEHQWGVAIDTSLEFSFITGDRNRYIVSQSFPSEGQENICPYLQFRIVFDAPISNSSLINAVSIESEDGDILSTKGATILSSNDEGHYYFSASEDLEYSKAYTLKLAGSIQDTDGIPLVDTVKIPFSTMQSPGNLTILDELESTSDWTLDFSSSTGLDASSFIYKWSKTYRSGSASLLLRYSFIDENSTAVLSPASPIAIDESAQMLNIWIWGELSENSVKAVFDNETETEFGIIDFAGWNFLSLTIPEDATELTGILISSNSGSTLSGDIYIDALSQPNTTGLNQVSGQSSIMVSPNPLLGNALKISGLESSESQFMIYGIDGKLLQSGSLESTTGEISLESSVINQDIFIVKILNEQEIFSVKIINNNHN